MIARARVALAAVVAVVLAGCGSGVVTGGGAPTDVDTGTASVEDAAVGSDVVAVDTEAAPDGALPVDTRREGDGAVPEVGAPDAASEPDADAVTAADSAADAADTGGSGGSLALPQVVDGVVDDGPKAVGLIRFVGRAATWIAVDVTATGFMVVEPRIELLPEPGTGADLFWVAESAGALTTRIFLPRDGLYVLAVSDRRNAASQTVAGPDWRYRAQIAEVASPVSVVPVTQGLPLNANLGAGGAEAVAIAAQIASADAVVTVVATEPVNVTVVGVDSEVEGVGAGRVSAILAGGGPGLRRVVVVPQDPGRACAVQIVVHAVAVGAAVAPGDDPASAVAAGAVGAVALGQALMVAGQAEAGGRDVLAFTADAGLELRVVGLEEGVFRPTLADATGGRMTLAALGSGDAFSGVVAPAGAAPGLQLLGVTPRGDGGAYEALVVAQRCGARGGATPTAGSLRVSEVLPAPPVTIAAPAGEAAGACGDAQGDGVIGASDAFVEVLNVGAAPLELGGVTLVVAGVRRFRFPCGAVLWPRQAAVVFAGGEASASAAAGALRGALVLRVPGGGGLGLERAGLSGRALVIAASDGTALDTVVLPSAPVAGFSLVRQLTNPTAGLKGSAAEGGCGDDVALAPWGYTPGGAPGGGSFAARLPAPAPICEVAPLVATGRGEADVSAGVPGAGCGASAGSALAYAVDLASGARLRARAVASSWNPTLSLATACGASECAATGTSMLDFTAPATARHTLWIAGAQPEDRGSFELDVLVIPP